MISVQIFALGSSKYRRLLIIPQKMQATAPCIYVFHSEGEVPVICIGFVGKCLSCYAIYTSLLKMLACQKNK